MPEQAAFKPAQTVDEVIERMEIIVKFAEEENEPWGIFPALYLITTRAIRDAIQAGDVFEDNERMEKMDVIFANRFLETFYQLDHGLPMTEVWQLYFGVSEKYSMYIIVQQLLVGINAHINLDLGIAAALVAPGDQLTGFKNDFNTINDIIAKLTKKVQAELDVLSPRIGLIDRWFKSADDAIMKFSIERARDSAWLFARELASLPVSEWNPVLARRDRNMVKIGKLILSPGFWGVVIVWWIKRRETSDISRIVAGLADIVE